MSWKETIKQFLIETFTSPIMIAIYTIIVGVALGFVVIVIMIKRRDKSGVVRPGMKASDLARSGAIPGVTWPEPVAGPGPSMIVEPTRPVNRTRIVFLPSGGKTDPGTDHPKPLRFGSGDTQPIEVTRDGEAPEGRHGAGTGDQDRPDPGRPARPDPRAGREIERILRRKPRGPGRRGRRPGRSGDR